MQMEYFGLSVMPTFISIWNWPPRLPLGPLNALPAGPEPLCVVVDVVAVVPEEATLAIPGEPAPPPQPAASSTTAPTVKAEVSMMGGRQRIAAKRDSPDSVTAGEQKLLPACNRCCGILEAGRGG
jgi:hypothetical protein